MSDPDDITRRLGELDRGRPAVDQLVPVLYRELRQLARRQLRSERRHHTLETTALIHEAYVKLVGLDRMTWQNRTHFLALAAQAMRRVLIDYAQARRAGKRGGSQVRVALDETPVSVDARSEELVALDLAMCSLEQAHPRLGRVVECRYFGGMSVDETARALDISPATVKRDWTIARAWLNRKLLGSQP